MSSCDCDSVESIRITSEYFGDWETEGRFRPRCGVCGGKLHDYPVPAELALMLPDPDEVPEEFIEPLADEFLDTDDPAVTITITIQDPQLDSTQKIEVSLDWWDNPHTVADDIAHAP